MARRSDHTRVELHAMILDAAREIVERDGFAGLTIRRIGEAIGYSSGTLYNLFNDLEDIVVHVNGATLDALYDELAAVPAGDDAEATFHAIADIYLRFVERRPLLWGLLFQNPLSGTPRPDWYYDRMDRLFAILEGALDPIFESGPLEAKRDAARVLWSGLHGLSTLATEGAVLSWDDVRRLAADLITNYIAGLRQPSRRDPPQDIGPDKSKSAE